MKNNNKTLHKLNFGLHLLEKNQIGCYYSELFNIKTNKLIYSSPIMDLDIFKKNIFHIIDVPNYLRVKEITESKNIKTAKINTYSGSIINLRLYKNIEDYLLNKISPKERSEIRRRQKRLDQCIKPVYKMYYGQISKAEYDVVFSDYREMLLRRLEQKQSYWEELDYWEERYKSTYRLINEKKACVFVIYQKEIPIAIYINSIFDTIIFNEVVAYDIDYSRFNIGILIFIKLIEWSINNQFELMDMSKGDFSYKERFKNDTYIFQNHVIYNINNIPIFLKANLLIFKLNLIYKLLPYLKKIKLNKLNTAFKRLKHRNLFKNYTADNKIVFEQKNINKIDHKINLKLINSDIITYAFLKKPIIDFAFLNLEFIDDISVYIEASNQNSFILKGKKSLIQLIRKNND